ncbi:MAG: hypothetical protein PHW11_00425 [Anaerolineaceae bacterium]|nr:hypothetical protein [Anaerolineaceae bacterium]MDD4042183.1 hypothetical protein [Anaerolineaceae bacterium]MDD4577019.1 hypothetical protein [Anaerolineaceae bacterium]
MSSSLFMFIPFLKQLVTDIDPGEIKRVEDVLKANDIPFRIKSSSPRGPFGRNYDSRAYQQIVMPLYIDAQRPTISYIIYVKPKDYDRAMSLIQ